MFGFVSLFVLIQYLKHVHCTIHIYIHVRIQEGCSLPFAFDFSIAPFLSKAILSAMLIVFLYHCFACSLSLFCVSTELINRSIIMVFSVYLVKNIYRTSYMYNCRRSARFEKLASTLHERVCSNDQFIN